MEQTMPSREEIEAELNTSEKDRAIDALLRMVEDFIELEAQITAEEERAGFERRHPNVPLVDRLERLGYRKATRDRIAELFDAVEDLRSGRPVSPQIKAMLAKEEAAIQSAGDQIAASAARGRQGGDS
jgi:hypothetical protein